jgi:hypothetical protein
MQFGSATHHLSPDPGPDRFGVAPPAHLRDRAAARLSHHRLDLALAEGASPERSAALALRARRLTSLSQRRSLAATYRRVVQNAREDRVNAAREELARIAEALAQPGPVATQGAAQALLLLTDGTGPLHNARAQAHLPAVAAEAAEHLQLR